VTPTYPMEARRAARCCVLTSKRKDRAHRHTQRAKALRATDSHTNRPHRLQRDPACAHEGRGGQGRAGEGRGGQGRGGQGRADECGREGRIDGEKRKDGRERHFVRPELKRGENALSVDERVDKSFNLGLKELLELRSAT
jgi:hypothetical protein